MDFSHVALPIALALFVIPGLHYDLLRARTAGSGGYPKRLHLSRILIAGLLITAAALTILCLISLIYPEFSFGFDGFTKNSNSPGVAVWTAICFTALSLTISALSATIMAYLEFHPRYTPDRVATAHGPQTLRRRMAKYADDIEVEVKLADGTTYRGLLGSNDLPDSYLVLTEPIFDIGDHGKPLPLDALHWPWLALSQSTIVSVMARPFDDGLSERERRAQLNATGPRHSISNARTGGHLKQLLQSAYQSRLDPYALARLLAGQVAFVTLMAVLARAFATLA
jgi:hypothetical protein